MSYSMRYPPIQSYIIYDEYREFTQRCEDAIAYSRSKFSQNTANRITLAFEKLYLAMSERGLIVAQKDRKDKRGNAEGFFKGFANIPFTADVREGFGAWREDHTDLQAFILSLMENGYKVSFSPDSEHKCVICTLTANAFASGNVGYAMVSRAPVWADALAVAIYKHFEVSGEDWSAYVRDGETDGWG